MVMSWLFLITIIPLCWNPEVENESEASVDAPLGPFTWEPSGSPTKGHINQPAGRIGSGIPEISAQDRVKSFSTWGCWVCSVAELGLATRAYRLGSKVR